jgi:serine protease
VTLIAAASQGSAFTGWSGCDSSSGSTCTVSVTSSRTVSATFAKVYTLTVVNNRVWFGSGTVSSDPAGISCGTTCLAYFPAGTEVTLTVTPGAESYFSGWGLYDCDSTDPYGHCTVTMTRDRAVEADFTGYP